MTLFNANWRQAGVLFIALLNLSSHVQGAPTPGEGLGNFLGAIGTTYLKPLFGEESVICPVDDGSCHGFSHESDKTGKKAQYAYYDGSPDDGEILDIDIAVMKCMIDLHSKQDTYCISTAGTPCEYGGGIMATRTSAIVGDRTFPQDSADIMMETVEGFKGVKLDYSKTFQVQQVSEINDSAEPYGLVFLGHMGTDC
ncbi:uncharacterized protein KY384_000054 [Bacidia gigantensis]|uniref:uncharacterized protein n=1 Tax=Bacidia gigantensis TaxID=2732470 RepID=UPI001D0562BA|nr:uncharacterized protein KY384_000054 [Bacidia gigantensis]KAG8526461.1 hypothetical protein KY384_000054 [Bacidia gigantensis]